MSVRPSLSERGSVCVSGPVRAGHPDRVGPILHPELPGEASPPWALHWNWLVGKVISYFLLIPLKCLYISHLSPCLILELLGVFI